jgi:hypothetical protein
MPDRRKSLTFLTMPEERIELSRGCPHGILSPSVDRQTVRSVQKRQCFVFVNPLPYNTLTKSVPDNLKPDFVRLRTPLYRNWGPIGVCAYWRCIEEAPSAA